MLTTAMTPQEPTDMGYSRLLNNGNSEDDARLPVLVLQLRSIVPSAPDDALVPLDDKPTCVIWPRSRKKVLPENEGQVPRPNPPSVRQGGRGELGI